MRGFLNVHTEPDDPYRADNVVGQLVEGQIVTGLEEKGDWVFHDAGGWSIRFHGGFEWTTSEAAKEPLLAQPPYFELSQIDLTIQAETLLAIISQEGQGKSSMLLAMMGSSDSAQTKIYVRRSTYLILS
eukprot:s1526_g9.t3